MVITITLPVNSSEPAMITRESATPKETPMTSLVQGEAAAENGAPTAKMRTIARPT
jgi:hypothetical protein